MIDAELSLKEAEGIRGSKLLAYLVANGWAARPSRVEGVSILSKNVEGAEGPIEFILPIKAETEDESRRVADALRAISQLEGRNEADVANEIRLFVGGNVGEEVDSITADKIAEEVLGTVKKPFDIDPVLFPYERSLNLPRHLLLWDDFDVNPYFETLSDIENLIYSQDSDRVSMYRIVNLTHELFERQYRDLQMHVVQGMAQSKRNVFLHHLRSTKVLESKIRIEILSTELNLLALLYDSRPSGSREPGNWQLIRGRAENKRIENERRKIDRFAEVLFLGHTKFLYDVIQRFMSALVQYEVL
jgi:hypothetical protein